MVAGCSRAGAVERVGGLSAIERSTVTVTARKCTKLGFGYFRTMRDFKRLAHRANRRDVHARLGACKDYDSLTLSTRRRVTGFQMFYL